MMENFLKDVVRIFLGIMIVYLNRAVLKFYMKGHKGRQY